MYLTIHIWLNSEGGNDRSSRVWDEHLGVKIGKVISQRHDSICF